MVQRVKDSTDIVELIKEFVPSLKQSGKNWIGKCPFHNDNNPSFSVSQEYGFYKCFSCGEGGDAISFIEKIEHLTFKEAVEELAKRSGISVDKSGDANNQSVDRAKFVDFNTKLVKLFRYYLQNDTSSKSRDYLYSRGVTDEAINVFNLGYVPGGYGELESLLIKKGYSKDFLAKTGVFVERDGDLRSMFFDRLMFPIYNHRDEPVGFGGRTLSPDGKPKYLNTQETVLYKKSGVLYGINTAKQMMKNSKTVYVVEGYMDVIGCYQGGLENVVAPCGTAMTLEQVKLLSRYVETIVLLFDGDEAGKKGALRAITEAGVLSDININVLLLPDGMDPFDYFKINSLDDFKEYDKNRIDSFDFILKEKASINHDNNHEVISSMKRVFDYIKRIENAVVKDKLLNRMASWFRVEETLIKNEFNLYKTRGNNYRSKIEGNNTQKVVRNDMLNSDNQREIDIILLFYHYQKIIHNSNLPGVESLINSCCLIEKYFSNVWARETFKKGLSDRFDNFDAFYAGINDEELKKYIEMRIMSYEFSDDVTVLKFNIIDRIIDLIRRYYLDKNKEIQKMLDIYERQNDLIMVKELQEEKTIIINEINKLKKLQELKG